MEKTGEIRFNQLGFYPHNPKIAIVPDFEGGEDFYILDKYSSSQVYQGKLSERRKSLFSEKSTRIADFSDLNKTGTFEIVVPGIGKSLPFEIKPEIHRSLAKGSLKAFYFQRMSIKLLPEFAGDWARPAGHPDDYVMVHASAASPQRPEGVIIAAPFGWYDAGDYNKYIVNSGITMGTLMALYEDFPAFIENIDLNIPESENNIPDLLDEVLWNLQWMLDMQDPHDGGIYHKLTTAKFEGKVMPHEAVSQRYVVAKSTAAALDFAAVMAQAHRVYKDYLPELSAQCLEAAESAWKWALDNPEMMYQQNEMNKIYSPEVTTGAYGDDQLDDEWVWAASELFISTQKQDFLDHIDMAESEFQLPSWRNVRWLGYYSLLRFAPIMKGFPEEKLERIKQALFKATDTYIENAEKSAYNVVMGQDEKDFAWGSNSVAANQGIALIQSYKLSQDQKYLNHALGNLDYILGRNATGYSYVTGFGTRTPMDPHHRPSGAEPEMAPVPGLLVGGPNPGQQDDCDYESDIPDESYVDDYCSYASNEIAINWNAPLAYLAVAVEALIGN